MMYLTKAVIYLCGVFIMIGCNNPDAKTRPPEQNEHANAGHQHNDHPHTHESTQAPSKPATAEEPAEYIPEFKFYKLKTGFGFEKSDILAGRNTVFILFDPSCRHCQIETGELAKHYNQLKEVNLLFVSMNDPALMDKFFPSFGQELEGKENVQLLYDRDQQFIRQFHVPFQFPANYVYGADGKLKSHWSGEKGIQEILAAFTN